MSHLDAYQPPSGPSLDKPSPEANPLEFALLLVLAAAVAIGGGALCGLSIGRFGAAGSASLWALGAIGGFVANKLLSGPSRLAGWILVLACVSALVVAETCWLHWETRQGAESWLKAISLLPTFVREYEVSALIAAMFTGFGAWSAYRQVALRYIRVPVA